MPAQVYSGAGNPNGVVVGNPGDFYQDETGSGWINTAAPSTWAQLNTGTLVFVPGVGAGSAIQNNGTGNSSTGADSTVCGGNNQISGDESFAEGYGNIESVVNAGAPGTGSSVNHLEGYGNRITVALSGGGGFNHVECNQNVLTGTGGNPCDFNHVEGNRNLLTAGTNAVEFNHVEGDGNQISAGPNGGCFDSHVEGIANVCTDIDGDHVEGYGNIVSPRGGSQNHVEGNQNTLQGASSVSFVHLEGNECLAAADTVHVEGSRAAAIRRTQHAKASGSFGPTAKGDAQTSSLVLRGSTPGLAPNESVELKYGDAADQLLTLEDGKAYVIRVRAIGYATDTNFMSFEGTFAANQEGGVITITPAAPFTVLQVAGTAGANTWTLTANIGAAPARISFTFTTGVGTTAAVRIACDIEFVEVARA